jgi:uncharacterized protein with PIN domain
MMVARPVELSLSPMPSAMIAFFENEPGSDQVEEMLRSLLDQKAKAFMSVINWGEIYYNTMKVQGVEEAERIITQLDNYPIQILKADRKLTHEAP